MSSLSEQALIKGNDLFVDELYEEALNSYNQSISQQASHNSNALLKRSACHYKLEKYLESLEDAEAVLQNEPVHPVALHRKGSAAFALGKYELAKNAFEALYEQKKMPEVKVWIRKCKAELEDIQLSFDGSSKEQTEGQESTQKESTQKESIQNESTQKEQKQEGNLNEEYPKSETPTNRPRHDWYQTQTNVFVNIFLKKVKPEQSQVDIQSKRISLIVHSDREYIFDIDLSGTIIPSETKIEYLSTKIEISLKKATGLQWPSLEEKKILTQKKEKKNWDKIVNEAGPLDIEGDELNKVFKDIYGNGTDEQRKAMIKSFVNTFIRS